MISVGRILAYLATRWSHEIGAPVLTLPGWPQDTLPMNTSIRGIEIGMYIPSSCFPGKKNIMQMLKTNSIQQLRTNVLPCPGLSFLHADPTPVNTGSHLPFSSQGCSHGDKISGMLHLHKEEPCLLFLSASWAFHSLRVSLAYSWSHCVS